MVLSSFSGEEERNGMTLEDDDAKVILLSLMARHRKDFPKSGSHTQDLEELRKMLLKQKICATVQELRKARMAQREQYNRDKVNDKNVHSDFF